VTVIFILTGETRICLNIIPMVFHHFIHHGIRHITIHHGTGLIIITHHGIHHTGTVTHLTGAMVMATMAIMIMIIMDGITHMITEDTII